VQAAPCVAAVGRATAVNVQLRGQLRQGLAPALLGATMRQYAAPAARQQLAVR